MNEDKLYYKVTGGAVKAAYEKFKALRHHQWEARQNLCKEFGARACYADSSRVVGLDFASGQTIPDGWRSVKGEPSVFRPPGNGAAFKEIRTRMQNDYPLVNARDFQTMVMGEDNMLRFMKGLTFRFMVPEMVGEQLVLIVPRTEEKVQWAAPEGCTSLKTSEYWQLKEAFNAEKEQP